MTEPRSGLRVGILGGAGLLGRQLIAILSSHPQVSEIVPFSRTLGGQSVSAAFPALKHVSEITYASHSERNLTDCDCIFSALPHGESFGYLQHLVSRKITFIDLSGDFRLADPALYRKVYGREHPLPDVLTDFVRVIPEINGEQCRNHRLISMQGCNSTAVLLALFPLLQGKLLAEDFINVDLKVSSSGSGGKAIDSSQLHYNRAGGVRAYKLLTQHRHTHEVLAFLASRAVSSIELNLNVFSVDMVRGILGSCYLRTAEGVDTNSLRKCYRSFYLNKPCIRIIRQSSGSERLPNPRYCIGTNFCDVGFEVDTRSRRAVIVSSIDNLIRGGAGQAVQAFNLHYGFSETAGLPMTPLYV